MTKILNWNTCKSKSINRKTKPSSSKSRRLWLQLIILILKRRQLLFTYGPYDMVYPLWNIYARIKTVLSRNNSCTSSCPRSKCKNCITFSNTLDEKINLKIYKKILPCYENRNYFSDFFKWCFNNPLAGFWLGLLLN